MPKRTIRKDGPHSVDVHVGKQVKAARHMASVSQEELGAALGITFQQIQKYEKGSNRVSASNLWLMSDFLGVPVTFFFDGLEVGSRKQSAEVAMVTDFISSRDGMNLIRAFSDIKDDNVRKRFIQLLQAMEETD